MSRAQKVLIDLAFEVNLLVLRVSFFFSSLLSTLWPANKLSSAEVPKVSGEARQRVVPLPSVRRLRQTVAGVSAEL